MYNKIFFEKSKYYNSKLYYAHIPKTAGTYTKKYLDGLIYNSKIDHAFSVNGIFSYSNIVDKKKKYFFKNYLDDFKIKKPLVFSTFRNPFDLLCSYYMHKRSTGLLHNGWLGCNDYHQFQTFKEFIISFADPNYLWHLPNLNNFLISQLFDINNKCIADFFISYENLSANLKVIKYLFMKKQILSLGFKNDLYKDTYFTDNLKNIIKTYRNLLFHDSRKKLRKSDNKIKDYRFYYDNEMIDSIYKKCNRELNLFGYDFENINAKKAILKNEDGFFDPKNLKYDVRTDEMKIIDV